MAAGQFSCDSCGKSYAWKPQLAGKRVKCKCGAAMSVPATDPAAAHDDGGGLDDFAALAHGAGTYDDGGGDAAAAGPRCPSCGEFVDPTAVICINCGTNLKTGKKLKTATVAAGAAAGGGGMPSAIGGRTIERAYGVKAVGEEKTLSNKQKAIIGGIIATVLIGILGTVIVITQKAKAKERERLAILDKTDPPRLERLLTNMEKSGGLVGAMKEGTLLEGVDDPRWRAIKNRPPQKFTKDGLNAYADSVGRKGPAGDAKWYFRQEDTTFFGMTREDSLKMVDMLYEKYKCRNVQCVLKKDTDKVCEIMIVTLPEWDENNGGPHKLPYRQEFRKWAEGFMKKLGDELPPEVNQDNVVFWLKAGSKPKGGSFGDELDEEMDDEDSEGADAQEDADEEEDATPAKPSNRKARPGKAKPGAPGTGAGKAGAGKPGSTPAQPVQ